MKRIIYSLSCCCIYKKKNNKKKKKYKGLRTAIKANTQPSYEYLNVPTRIILTL